jgi:hypothetical protein
VSLSRHSLKISINLVLISLLVITLIFSSTSSFYVFAKKKIVKSSGYVCSSHDTGLAPGKTRCCETFDYSDKTFATYCTDCDDTSPPSNCGPRFEVRQPGSEPPTNVAPPKVCPDGSSPDANGVCPPVTQGTPPSPPPKGATGAIEQPPTNLASPSKMSQRAFSPTGGCVPGGTTCIPCDPGLATHGANCIPSGDWHPGSSGLGTELGGGGSSTPPTVQPPPAQSGVIEQPPSQHHKGSNLLGQTGGSTSTKKANNDNSPTPPACPEKPPLPLNCTVKPKF